MKGQNIEIGNCYLYLDLNNKKHYALIIESIEGNGEERSLEFIPVLLESNDIKDLNDVVTFGVTFTVDVFNGELKSYRDGFYLISVDYLDLLLFKNFKHLGKLILDSQKYTIGGGTSAIDELDLQRTLIWKSNGDGGYQKKKLSLYVKK
ncbi:MAG: hypothetical protein ACK5QC_01840 [Bacteroidota bacterium]